MTLQANSDIPLPMPKEGIPKRKFVRNVRATRIICAVLSVEQTVYGMFFSIQGSRLQHIYYLSALLIFLLFLSTFLFSFDDTKKHRWIHALYEMLPLALGMSLALVRMMNLQGVVVNIPTIYLAVLYGGAVIFMLSYWQSGILYSLLAVCSIIGVEHGLQLAPNVPFRADFIVNCGIAWAVSATNYRSFLHTQEKSLLINLQNAQLLELSERDWLTGLYNRRKLDEFLTGLAQSPGQFTSILLFDLDWFKQVNDTYGHQVGDQVLQKLAKVVQSVMLADEVVGRWGGEEFILLCRRDGAQLAEELRLLISSTSYVQEIHLTASFGVIRCSERDSVQALIAAVDKRLYRAKQLGRNQMVCSDAYTVM